LSEAGPRLRRMEARDLPSAMEIDALSLPRPWSAAIWRGELGSPYGLYLVIEDRGEVFGHIGVRHVFGELHITTIAIRPEYRRRGHARALIGAALAAYPDASHVHLEVRLERLQQQQRRGEAGQKRDEDDACDQRIGRTPEHVDEKDRQHHQRYKGEK
jgi:ribosomal-protein-alanine N-acetyltransferase